MTVRAVDRSFPASAEQIAELELHVRYRLGGRVRDFELAPAERGLILRGRTRSYYAKQLAQYAVMEVAGQAIAANEIEVSG
jgi:hypothetical protein